MSQSFGSMFEPFRVKRFADQYYLVTSSKRNIEMRKWLLGYDSG